MSDGADDLPQLAINLALDVAESEHRQAGPNVARVLAAEVRRLRALEAELPHLQDLLSCFEGQQQDNDRLRVDCESFAAANSVYAREVARLDARVAHEQATITQIEAVCIRHGYDAESGEPAAHWLRKTLTEGTLYRGDYEQIAGADAAMERVQKLIDGADGDDGVCVHALRAAIAGREPVEDLDPVKPEG